MIPVLEQAEAVIIVVSAKEGINSQTKEYALISRQFGIEKMFVYVNKTDAVDEKKLREIQAELPNLMKEYGYYIGENLLICAGSALEIVKGFSESSKFIIHESISKILVNL